jgi:hypothetical protein
MSDFTELYAYIETQIENLLKDWKEENDWKDGDDLEEFFLYYTNHENSMMYYDISDDELNDTYREGSVWILERLNEWGADCNYIIDAFKKISNDNEEYEKQLVYFIAQEL